MQYKDNWQLLRKGVCAKDPPSQLARRWGQWQCRLAQWECCRPLVLPPREWLASKKILVAVQLAAQRRRLVAVGSAVADRRVLELA